MINLQVYDTLAETINKNKTWVDITYKRLFSREIHTYKYYLICKKYNVESNCNDYYIVFTNVYERGKGFKSVKVDNYGRIKVSLSNIWNNTILKDITKNTNINITLIDKDNDSVVYYLDI